MSKPLVLQEVFEKFGITMLGATSPVQETILPELDAREHALRRLREFIALIPFRRSNGILSRINRLNIHVFQPDSPKDMVFPSVAFLPGQGVHETAGLGPSKVMEDCNPGEGLAEVWLGEYSELFTIEIVAAKHASRRAIVAGLIQAFRLSDDTSSLRLTLPDYHNQVAVFTLNDTLMIDDPNVVRNRRRAHLFVELRVPEVAIVPRTDLETTVEIEVSTDVEVDAQVEIETSL